MCYYVIKRLSNRFIIRARGAQVYGNTQIGLKPSKKNLKSRQGVAGRHSPDRLCSEIRMEREAEGSREIAEEKNNYQRLEKIVITLENDKKHK